MMMNELMRGFFGIGKSLLFQFDFKGETALIIGLMILQAESCSR